ncbi:polysaccharide biosynthesis/export family protein [Glaciimonas sp. CA11.2]|uniref:polysaccharide biosynthesis/export family protein n=1 Tax=Glaciimonas sp. CA11.2 TaxID=3048601 RepID=UPI002AB383EF|nr:polysaccharide biosynthesis/export family protein [Glaciimonas sp. CA11.2]MDY7545665.1 polysaccharide biosynthesis/export family protein [Glaciimonas sp. CA11.2]MEB0161489.1 polysaccharide biosynthesis/export family protein [Glaciimonas sp. CA11.2]
MDKQSVALQEQNQKSESVDSSVTPVLKTITPQLLQAEKIAREQQASQDISQLVASPSPYLIGSGDVLSIVVWDHPELSTPAMTSATTISTSGATDVGASSIPGFVVDQDGLVQFPYAGPLKLAGLTEAQARTLLTRQLKNYLKKPDLTLRVQAYRSKRIYIDGEVKMPGIQSINDLPMTLMEAVSRAGGFLPTGDQSQVDVTRAGKTYRVNLPQLLQKGINPANILLANGDVVRVIAREESKVFVLGEVTRPTTLTLRNGRLTLNEALGDAGGLNQLSAEGRQVYVVRNTTDMHPIVYNLDARSPVALALAENFELKAKDVVYVDASALANWARVIALLVPSAQSLTSAVQVTK